jgi:hypothetical protein
MQVIRHPTERMKPSRLFFEGAADDCIEKSSIGGRSEKRLLVIPAQRHVVKATGNVESKSSCHAASVRARISCAKLLMQTQSLE